MPERQMNKILEQLIFTSKSIEITKGSEIYMIAMRLQNEIVDYVINTYDEHSVNKFNEFLRKNTCKVTIRTNEEKK